MDGAGDKIRLDKWLWHARFFKTRSLAAKICKARKVRINGDVCTKSAATVMPGDVLTFPQGPHVRVAKILAVGTRRGPAPEAQSLYEDLAPIDAQRAQRKAAEAEKPMQREPGSGRPTKAERRAIDRLMDKG